MRIANQKSPFGCFDQTVDMCEASLANAMSDAKPIEHRQDQ